MAIKTNSEQSLLAANNSAGTISRGNVLEDQISSLLVQSKSPSQLTGLDSLALAAPAAVQSLVGGPAVSNDTVDYFQDLTSNAVGYTSAAGKAGELAGIRDRQQSLAATSASVTDAFRTAGQNQQAQEEMEFQRLTQQQDFNQRLAEHNDDKMQMEVQNQQAAAKLALSAETLSTNTFFRGQEFDQGVEQFDRQFKAGRSDESFDRGLANRKAKLGEDSLAESSYARKFENAIDAQQLKLQKQKATQDKMTNLMSMGMDAQRLTLQINEQNQALIEYKDAAPIRAAQLDAAEQKADAADLQRQKGLKELEVIKLTQGNTAAEAKRAEMTRTEDLNAQFVMQDWMDEIQKGAVGTVFDPETGGEVAGKGERLSFEDLAAQTLSNYGQQLLIMSPNQHRILTGIVTDAQKLKNDTTKANKVSGSKSGPTGFAALVSSQGAAE